MKKIVVGILALIVAMPVVVGAAVIQSGENYSLPAAQSVLSDLYAAGGSVSLSGIVNGDAVLAGGNVNINGSTTQGVLAAGGTLNLTGRVGDDIRAAGGNITIGGTVARDIVIAGGQINVLSGTEIGGDALIGAGTLVLDGHVRGMARIGGGDVVINGTIDGPVTITADRITLGPTAVIGGNLTYKSPTQITIQNGAQVSGETTQLPYEKHARRGAESAITSLLSKFFMILAAALVHALVVPRVSNRIVDETVSTNSGFWMNVLRGLGVLILMPIAAIILAVTFIGLPLAFITILSYIILLIVSCIFTAVVVGSLLDKWFFKRGMLHVNWRTVLLGAAVVTIINLIPVIGPLVTFIVMLGTIGAITKIKYNWIFKKGRPLVTEL